MGLKKGKYLGNGTTIRNFLAYHICHVHKDPHSIGPVDPKESPLSRPIEVCQPTPDPNVEKIIYQNLIRGAAPKESKEEGGKEAIRMDVEELTTCGRFGICCKGEGFEMLKKINQLDQKWTLAPISNIRILRPGPPSH